MVFYKMLPINVFMSNLLYLGWKTLKSQTIVETDNVLNTKKPDNIINFNKRYTNLIEFKRRWDAILTSNYMDEPNQVNYGHIELDISFW